MMQQQLAIESAAPPFPAKPKNACAANALVMPEIKKRNQREKEWQISRLVKDIQRNRWMSGKMGVVN